MDEMQELERLRKLKRLQELEAMAAGGNAEPMPEPPPPAPMPEQQAQPERQLLNIVPELPEREIPEAGQQNLLEEIVYAGRDVLETGVGALDLGRAVGRDIVADTAAMVQQIGNGLFKLTRTESNNELKIEDAELLRKVEQTRNFLGSEVYTEEGRELQRRLAESLREGIEGNSLGNGLAVISQGIDSVKNWLTEQTGSQVYTDALLSAGALGLEYLTAGTAGKGYKVGKAATLTDVRKTALALDDKTFNVDKMRDLRNTAYEELGAVDVRQGTYNRALNSALNDMPADDSALITPFIEQQLKKQRTVAASREAKFGRNYNERVSDITNLQREMQRRAAEVGDPKEAYALQTAARNLDRFLFDEDNVGFLQFGYEDMAPEQVKKLRGDSQRIAGQIIRHNQIQDIMERAADSYGGEKGKLVNFSKYMAEFLQDKSKSRFFSDYEKALMREIADEAPLSSDGETISSWTRIFGSKGGSSDGSLVMAAKTGRAISPTMRQIALVQPARYIENLVKGRRRNYGKAYDSLVTQVLAGQGRTGDINGETVIKRYLSAVPKNMRDFEVLGEILAMHSTDLQDIKLENLASKIQKDAVAHARGLQILSAGLTQEAIQNGVIEEGTLPDFKQNTQKKDEEENRPQGRDYVGDYNRRDRMMR